MPTLTDTYPEKDALYDKYPELRELIKAAQWVAGQGVNSERLEAAIKSLRVAGTKWDNRTL